MTEKNKNEDTKTTAALATFRDSRLYSAINNVGSQIAVIKKTMHDGTLLLARDIHDKLSEWVDSLKGKDKDPDNYMPHEHAMLLGKIRKSRPVMFKNIIDAGIQIRNLSSEDRTPERVLEIMRPIVL